MKFNYVLRGLAFVIERKDCSTDGISRSNKSCCIAGLSTMHSNKY
jgi:hypothetical protein